MIRSNRSRHPKASTSKPSNSSKISQSLVNRIQPGHFPIPALALHNY
jgi:hypothetical protein